MQDTVAAAVAVADPVAVAIAVGVAVAAVAVVAVAAGGSKALIVTSTVSVMIRETGCHLTRNSWAKKMEHTNEISMNIGAADFVFLSF